MFVHSIQLIFSLREFIFQRLEEHITKRSAVLDRDAVFTKTVGILEV